mgnify:CR=1 FL=1
MAVKKAAVAAKKAPAKKAPAKKAAAKGLDSGDKYACDVCGLTVVVDEVCGCTEVHEILCCSKPMKQKKAKAKVRTAK